VTDNNNDEGARIYRFTAPGNTLVLTPTKCEPNYTYGRTPDEVDFIGFEFEDLRAGPTMLALSPGAVEMVIEGLRNALDNIEEMRAAYDRANGLGDQQ